MKLNVLLGGYLSAALVFVLALAVGLGLVAGPAASQSAQCGPIDMVMTQLAERHREHLVSHGAMDGGGLLMIFASEASGTWTVVVLAPDGVGCVKASGFGWEGAALIEGEPT